MDGRRTITLYFVRHVDPISKKWFKTRWRMTEEDAAKLYAGQEYEILWLTKEERVIGGKYANNTGHLYAGFSETPKSR